MQMTFDLAAQPQFFAPWIEARTRFDPGSPDQQIRTDNGYFRLRTIGPDREINSLSVRATWLGDPVGDIQHTADFGEVIKFDWMRLDENRIRVEAKSIKNDLFEQLLVKIWADIFVTWPGKINDLVIDGQAFDTQKNIDKYSKDGKPGAPGLDHGELIKRLAMAQEAEEIRRDTPGEGWKIIARQVGWHLGFNQAGIKLFEDARNRLKRIENGDPVLIEIAEARGRNRG